MGRGDEVSDDSLNERLRHENRLLRWRYDVVAWHADLHAHAAQRAMVERDAALAELARVRAELEAAAPSGRSILRRRGVSASKSRQTAVALEASTPASTWNRRRGSVAAIVISRDRLDCLRLLVAWLERAPGIGEIHIVDNASTWPALVEYLDASPHTVHRLGVNLGHHAPWITGLISEVAHAPFLVTDPDVIPDEACPDDVIEHLRAVLARHPGADKVGLGLRIDDLPERFAHRDAVVRWESKFWTDEVEPGVFRADVDTTFALYRAGRDHKPFNSLRTASPYVARHLPWYADTDAPTAEDVFYRQHADPAIASWTGEELPVLYRDGAGGER
jgi:hypothetical protein